MAEAKKSAKGQKIGRNSRAPSNQMQERRTEKNKRLNSERAHSLKMKQMEQGGKTEEVYRGLHRIDPAIKFVNSCVSLWDARQRRIRVQRELAGRV